MRIGHGYDVHRLKQGRKLILGGVEIPYGWGLDGHSDADVLTHAVMDALLGAAALGDIGQHFPDTDPAYLGADSMALLREVIRLLEGKGYRVEHRRHPYRPKAQALPPSTPDGGEACRSLQHFCKSGQCQSDHRRRAGVYRIFGGNQRPRGLPPGIGG